MASSTLTPPPRTVRKPSCDWGQPAKGWPRSVPPLLGARVLPPPSHPGGRFLLLNLTSSGGDRQRHRYRARPLRSQLSAVAASFFGVRAPRLPRTHHWLRLPLPPPIHLGLPMLAFRLPPAGRKERSATPRRLEMKAAPLLAHQRCRRWLGKRGGKRQNQTEMHVSTTRWMHWATGQVRANTRSVGLFRSDQNNMGVVLSYQEGVLRLSPFLRRKQGVERSACSLSTIERRRRISPPPPERLNTTSSRNANRTPPLRTFSS